MKRTPLHRYTPLRPRARRRKRIYTVDDKYRAFISGHPCLAAGHAESPCSGYVDPHHVGENGQARRNDYRTVPLCYAHHLAGFGPDAVHTIHREAFEAKFGVSFAYAISSYQREWSEAGGRIKEAA